MGIIYEPSGPAREYAPLACNYYPFCTHGCRYCYCPGILRQRREVFHREGDPKTAVAGRVRNACRSLVKRGQTKDEVLLSFVGDPYQPAESRHGLTREVIGHLVDNGLPFTVLTKGGTAACQDFDLMAKGRGRFGTSLVWWDDRARLFWEPGAKSVRNRVVALFDAKVNFGLSTWVSLEPVIDPAEALTVIRELHEVVDRWAIGKINGHPQIERDVDWRRFRDDAETLLQNLGADYFFKESLTWDR